MANRKRPQAGTVPRSVGLFGAAAPTTGLFEAPALQPQSTSMFGQQTTMNTMSGFGQSPNTSFGQPSAVNQTQPAVQNSLFGKPTTGFDETPREFGQPQTTAPKISFGKWERKVATFAGTIFAGFGTNTAVNATSPFGALQTELTTKIRHRPIRTATKRLALKDATINELNGESVAAKLMTRMGEFVAEIEQITSKNKQLEKAHNETVQRIAAMNGEKQDVEKELAAMKLEMERVNKAFEETKAEKQKEKSGLLLPLQLKQKIDIFLQSDTFLNLFAGIFIGFFLYQIFVIQSFDINESLHYAENMS